MNMNHDLPVTIWSQFPLTNKKGCEAIFTTFRNYCHFYMGGIGFEPMTSTV